MKAHQRSSIFAILASLSLVLALVVYADQGSQNEQEGAPSVGIVSLKRIDRLIDGGSWRYQFVSESDDAVAVYLVVRGPFMNFPAGVEVFIKKSGRTSKHWSITPGEEVGRLWAKILLNEFYETLDPKDLRRHRLEDLSRFLGGKGALLKQPPLKSIGWETYE